ncbi:acid phosphatase AphA [Endozoicomonas sp. Mp262]|uniref:acid phosphatase AphA n=1 Tax=Endozoicomonas sp. Mp262 TaxID=2919499 RepID=UPI0021D92970
MKKALISSLALSFALVSPFTIASTQASSTQTGVTSAEVMQRAAVHWVSVDSIRESLKDVPPMAVGFDIDDTVLYSSPGFVRGKTEFSPDNNDYLENTEFWAKMNTGWDEFSIPKRVAKELIKMHQERGDTIYFVTARPYTKGEKVTEIIQKAFDIKNMQPVVFADKANNFNKTDNLKKRNIKVFYGDADGDITSAQAVGARAIRIMRAVNSSYYPLPKNGQFGEEVIINSQA